MAINWTEAQIEEVVAAVIKNLGGATTAKSGWDSTQYNGRRLIGIYTDMEDAIEAATIGYKAIRAMSLEEREKVIANIRDLCRKEAPIMANLGVAETKMGRLQRKDQGQVTETNQEGAKREVYQEHFKQDVGLSVKDWRSTCRIANIDVDKLEAGEVDILALLRKGYHKVYRHAKKQGQKLFIYASPAIVEALDKAATDKSNVMLNYKTYGGEDIAHYKNVPIRTIDQILETEEQVKVKA